MAVLYPARSRGVGQKLHHIFGEQLLGVLLILEVVDEDTLICKKCDEPHDLADSHFKVLGLHQLLAEVSRPP